MSRLKAVGAVLGIISGLCFALFIIEEGLQVLMFASWAGKDVSKETRQAIVDMYAGANTALKALNNTIGIFVPPMHVAYGLYAKNGDIWLQAQVEGYGLKPPLPYLGWVADLLYSTFAFLGLVTLVIVVSRVVNSRAAAESPLHAQLREIRKGGGKK